MTQPALILTGTPEWTAALEQQIGNLYRLVPYTQHEHMITRLTDDRAALILVNGEAEDWRFWTTTPKVSPATRRIPVVLVTDNKNRRAEALLAGADLVLSPAELIAQIKDITRDYARVLDAATQEELDCQCEEPLPPLAVEGVTQFNAGEYYRQHDLFEALWMETPGPVRQLYQAILQVGIAYFQIERGNYRGAFKMLLRSVQWLSVLPDVCQGVDVQQLREDSYRVRAELERLTPDTIGQFDHRLLKPVKRVDPASDDSRMD